METDSLGEHHLCLIACSEEGLDHSKAVLGRFLEGRQVMKMPSFLSLRMSVAWLARLHVTSSWVGVR